MINSWACVDASLVVRLVAGPNSTLVRILWDQWDAANRRVAAPSLIYYEVTKYDAHYLALAARLGAEFWTADQRLVNTVQSALPWVRFVGV